MIFVFYGHKQVLLYLRAAGRRRATARAARSSTRSTQQHATRGEQQHQINISRLISDINR